jgi:hypothetical protein
MPTLEFGHVISVVLLLQVARSAKLTKRATPVAEVENRSVLAAVAVTPGDDVGLDHTIHLLVDLADGIDEAEVSGDTALLLVQLEEGEAMVCKVLGGHGLGRSRLVSHSLVDGGVEHLHVEHRCAVGEPLVTFLVRVDHLVDLATCRDDHLFGLWSRRTPSES